MSKGKKWHVCIDPEHDEAAGSQKDCPYCGPGRRAPPLKDPPEEEKEK